VPELFSHKLLFVTGKGGVGKTTVAAAIALLASEQGKRTLVCEAEPKGDLARAYECGPTPFAGRRVSDGLVAMSMDTEASLREYLRVVARVPTVGHIGPVARAFDFVATAAPGIREILTVGKLCFEVREGHYDLVVVDASSTGSVVGQLAAPTGINELIRVGVVRQQTDWILDILGDPARTGAVLVTTPEEMPVTEAVDLAGRLAKETPVHLACVVANRVLPELFGRSEEQIFNELARPSRLSEIAGELDSSRELVEDVLGAARLAVTVRRDGVGHLERLRAEIAPEVPLLYLPYLFARSHGLRAVLQVARALSEELLT
jgi:anion-transporting  ArsA/GET3 family ATPase